MSKPRKKYSMENRLKKAYKNYSERYDKKAASLKKKGLQMMDKKLNEKEYLMNREGYINEGVTTNINQTMVAAQAYAYSAETARRFKKIAKEAEAKGKELSWKDLSLSELRQGGRIKEIDSFNDVIYEEGLDVDVSSLNEDLKAEHPGWTGKQRQKYISHEVFGSD